MQLRTRMLEIELKHVTPPCRIYVKQVNKKYKKKIEGPMGNCNKNGYGTRESSHNEKCLYEQTQ